MRILLIEDDPAIRNLVKRSLTDEGYAIDVFANAEEALSPALEGIHDLFIVDLSLPGMDGLQFIEQSRGQGIRAPVLILSARRSVDERVAGLEKGGDDYLTKPFALAELLARVRALLRRASGIAATESTKLRVADLEIDLLRRDVKRGDVGVELTSKEFALLEYLVRNVGRVVTRSMILDHVWNMRFAPLTNVVDVHMHRLRTKVDGDFARKLIHTVRGAGYVIEAR